MYKCRRIISCGVMICLFLAFVAPSIIVSVHAEDGNSQISILYRTINQDGTVNSQVQRNLQEGFFLNQGIYGIQVDGFQYRPLKGTTRETFYFTFRIGGYTSNDVQFSMNVSNSAITHVRTSTNIDVFDLRSFASGRNDDLYHAGDSVTWTPSSKTSTWIVRGITKSNEQYDSFNINLTTPYQIKPTQNTPVWFYIDNIYFNYILTDEANYYVQALPFLSSINDYVFQLYNQMIVRLHPYTQIAYDEETGEFTTSNNVGNWFDAVLGSIQSLNADAVAQATQQERANEAGAGDALDTAYDSVGDSFGSLGEFSGLGDLGTFNGTAMGNAGSAGILDWFSQQTANSIDQVARSRAPLDIVDFYTSKIEGYEEVIADGSADP